MFAAKLMGIPTGGSIPNGFLTCAGNAPWLGEVFGLEEFGIGYPARTKKNAQDADATIRFATNFNSPGEILTLRECRIAKKPVLDVDLNRARTGAEEQVVQFLVNNDVRILNVAGNADRQKKFDTHFDKTFDILLKAFQILKQQGHLNA